MGFQIDNGVLVKYTEEPGITEVVIPEGVTSIGNGAFYWCESLINIHIPENVTSIGERAFEGCRSLTSIHIPEGVTSIGERAFEGCRSLTSIHIPEGVTSIGDSAFFYCTSLTRIVIPEGVTSIGESAFSGCSSLTRIVIPETITRIGAGAFSWCWNLTSIVIPEGVNLFSLVNPDGLTRIGDRALSGWKSLTNLVIPDGVTNIGDSAFESCSSLTSIVIPEGVTSIGDEAFSGCERLTDLVIPQGVTSIGNGVFEYCDSLTSIIIPESVTSIGKKAFYYCRHLTSLVIPKRVTNIGDEAFEGCTSLKEIQNIDELIRKGCKVHATTLIWMLENLWNGPEFLSETAQVYLTNPAKTVTAICESRLYENCGASADAMLGLIEAYKSKASALKRIATFALTCGGELPREKLIAIYEALKEIGAKPALKLLEEAVRSDSAPTLEGGTGHPIEAICLKRYKEAIVDKGLKDYKIPLNLFEGVHYKDTKTLAPPFVLKCAIFPYMQQVKELTRDIGGYQSDSQIDEIADTLDREELQVFMERLISECDPLEQPRLLLPYCRYGSGKQMNALAALGKKWTDWGMYSVWGRRADIAMRGAMTLNDSREAMRLVEKWGLLEEYAKHRNTTADVLRDTVLTEFRLDADGSKRYDLGNAVIAASIMQDLSVSLFNETTSKEVKSLPKRGADPEKYAAASEDFADLKKNIKNAVKSRVERLKEDFVSGRELKAADWKASYLNNYVLKRVASLLVWQWKNEESTTRFMLTVDGTFIGCNGQPVEVSDAGSIAVAHPVEIPAEELECWKTLLTDQQIAQPFVQIFEPICDMDSSVVVAQYEGIELPMFLLRGLAKEGVNDIDFMYEGGWLHIQGKAITINANVISDGYFYTERAIPFDAIVRLNKVKIEGTPRAVNHEIYAMDKALIENRVRNGDIAAVQASSRVITAKTVQHLIDVSIQVEQMEVTAWLMNYKNDHFPYTFADLEL